MMLEDLFITFALASTGEEKRRSITTARTAFFFCNLVGSTVNRTINVYLSRLYVYICKTAIPTLAPRYAQYDTHTPPLPRAKTTDTHNYEPTEATRGPSALFRCILVERAGV